MGGSPGFGSCACDHIRPIKTRFRSGSGYICLSRPQTTNSLAHYAKGTQSPRTLEISFRKSQGCGAPIPWTHHISETISSPFRGAFHLSLTVLSAIDLCTYLALDGGPPRFRPGFTCPILLRKSLPCFLPSATGLSPSMAALSRVVCLEENNRILGSYNPPHPLHSTKNFLEAYALT